MNNDRQRGTLQSGQRLFEVVETLQKQGGAGVTELADHFGVNRGYIHKYLKTLESNGYVVNNDGNYTLSFKFVAHAEHVKTQSELYNLTEDRVKELANDVDNVVKFSVRQSDKSIVVLSENDENLFSEKYMLGRMSSLHQSAPGKAMLAELPDDEIRRIILENGLPAREDNTITDENRLWKEIKDIRAQGVAVSIGEWDHRINGIGAAIANPKTGTLGAINIAGPAKQHSREQLISEYRHKILQVTSQLELKLSE